MGRLAKLLKQGQQEITPELGAAPELEGYLAPELEGYLAPELGGFHEGQNLDELQVNSIDPSQLGEALHAPPRGVVPEGSAPVMTRTPPERPEVKTAWLLPTMVGMGGATAYWKRKELLALARRLGIGGDATEDFLRQARYVNPRMAQLASRVVGGG